MEKGNITSLQHLAVAKALAFNMPFALYALPGEKDYTFLASENSRLTRDNYDGPYFLLGEFGEAPGKSVIIPYDFTERDMLTIDKAPEKTRTLVQPCDKDTDKLDYMAMVYAVVYDLLRRRINHGEHGKVVISRILTAKTKGLGSLMAVAEEYFDKFPNTFRYIAHHPATGTWIGATPEVVMDYDPKDHVLRTEALAGTLQNEHSVWDRKNRQEHNMVKDHILSVLADHKARVIGGKNNLKTVEKNFGRLRHLWTPISASVHPTEVTSILADLAPTPAVAGYPQDYAVRTIIEQELHVRRCYGGCVGIVKPDMESKIFANLRCALGVLDLKNRTWTYNIYAGGGITADSDPVTEWVETEAKAAPLCRAIKTINNHLKAPRGVDGIVEGKKD